MTIERARRIAHNLDVPDAKRKFWPKWAVVVVRPTGEVPDVIQFFEHPTEEESLACLKMYPGSISFIVTAGRSFISLDAFSQRIDETVVIAKKLLR